LLGGFGVHKFYLNKAGLGVLYILFSWTFVPSIIALIEGIIYLTQDDATFSRAQRVAVQSNKGW
jgi:TM2 domain-containing membrane protein YozV